MTKQAVVPTWVIADHRQVADLNHLAYVLATKVGSVHGRGQLAALGWVTGVERAPLTDRGRSLTWGLARAESWTALSVAARRIEPSAEEWAMLGVEPRPWVTGDEDYAHGAWRTLAWLLGVRPDPPTELPLRDEDGRLLPGQERYATPPNPRSAAWREADARRRERNRSEARRWYEHVRSRIDAQQRAAPASS